MPRSNVVPVVLATALLAVHATYLFLVIRRGFTMMLLPKRARSRRYCTYLLASEVFCLALLLLAAVANAL